MTVTYQQVRILMKARQKYTQEQSAAKAGMSTKTAHKYLQIPPLANRPLSKPLKMYQSIAFYKTRYNNVLGVG
jgi:response regulator of citrate/malate metabolism